MVACVHACVYCSLPSVLQHCWLGIRQSIRPVKIFQWCGAGMVICLEWSEYNLHMVQMMPLPPIISCFITIQNGLSFWCRLTQVVLEKKPLNGRSSSSSSSSSTSSLNNSGKRPRCCTILYLQRLCSINKAIINTNTVIAWCYTQYWRLQHE